MVWIYGGGFLVGAPDLTYFGPDYFLEENIIVVHFSYRLGPFGKSKVKSYFFGTNFKYFFN